MEEFIRRALTETHPKAKMKDLMGLTKAEREGLREALENSHGTAQLWVHSHFNIEEWNEGPYIDEMNNLIERSSTNIPIIALIEAPFDLPISDGRIKKYTEYYSKGRSRTIYYVRTGIATPTPCIKNVPEPRGSEDEQANWDTFAHRLKEVGVRKVIVSGKYFGEAEDPYDRGCVGFTVHQLKNRSITPFVSKVTPHLKR